MIRVKLLIVLLFLMSCTQNNDSTLNEPINEPKNDDSNSLLDYFPLTEGNTWKFSYFGGRLGCEDPVKEGQATWLLQKNSETEFTIMETRSGIQYRPACYGEPSNGDTTLWGPDTLHIDLLLSNETLTIDYRYPESSMKIPVGKVPVKDTIRVIDQYTVPYASSVYDVVCEVETDALQINLKLLKDVGPVFYSRITGVQDRWTNRYRLIEYNLN